MMLSIISNHEISASAALQVSGHEIQFIHFLFHFPHSIWEYTIQCDDRVTTLFLPASYITPLHCTHLYTIWLTRSTMYIALRVIGYCLHTILKKSNLLVHLICTALSFVIVCLFDKFNLSSSTVFVGHWYPGLLYSWGEERSTVNRMGMVHLSQIRISWPHTGLLLMGKGRKCVISIRARW